jgi:GNAT superfamily N-acetyltransferase
VTTSGYTFIFGKWDRDADDIRLVRDQVFREELGFGEGFIDERGDSGAIHVLVYEGGGGRAVGAARMQADGLIDYVAVLRPWRGNTVGGAIVSYLAHIAQVKNMETLWSEVTGDSLAFFRKNGFNETGVESGRGDTRRLRVVRPLEDSSAPVNIH